MRYFLLLLLPLLALAQFSPQTDKPCGPLCAHSHSAERWLNTSLDAESLHTYDQRELTLDLAVQNGDLPLVGRATILLRAREPLTEILFNAEELEISEVFVNGTPAEFTHILDTLHVNRAVAQNEDVEVAVVYSVEPNSDWFDTGFQTGWEQAYTFSEPFGARRWYPCWDQPSDKFDHVNTSVEMPENWTLAANGRWTHATFPFQGRIRHFYEYDQPISTYLVHFAAGNFSNQIFEQDGVQYRYFAWPRSDSAQAAYDWERTPEMVEYFSGLFGDYPFDAYGMVMTDIFGGWGAMEHQTFTTYGFNLVDSARTFEGIVAHELAHQWFGDHLSPVDFRNMWLNEGFATYGDALWSEHLGGEEGLNNYMAQSALNCINEEQNFPPSYSVYDPPIERIFGTNVYYKGAWVLHMLRKQILGDSLYFAVMQDWVETYGGGNVSTQDFIDIINEHYDGEDIDWFFDQWVYGLGYPEILMTMLIQPGDSTIRIAVIQQSQNLFRFPLWYSWEGPGGVHVDSVWIPAQSFTERFISTPGVTSVGLLAEQPLLFEAGWVNAPEKPTLPTNFSLAPAYPNPFNPSVTIPFTLGKTGEVELTLFDITGRNVATVFEGKLNAGEHSLQYLAPSELAAGVYLLRATSGEVTQTQKLLLLK